MKNRIFVPKNAGKVHELKTLPEYFKALRRGEKTFEIRKNDRRFSVGDILKLREFIPCPECNGTARVPTGCGDCDPCGCKPPHGRYTNKTLWFKVTYILEGGQFGIEG